MRPVILVLVDGLNMPAAKNCMCFMAALRQSGHSVFYEIGCELPPLSRPLYTTLLTGLSPLEHGILRNEDEYALEQPTLFSKAAGAGLTTAAAAYHWFFELVCGRAFNPLQNRFHDDISAPIQHGIFYSHDDYPDAELFADAESLRRRHTPRLLLVHAMGVDNAGHKLSGDWQPYFEACSQVDSLLALYVPLWLEAGYLVMVTSDHGMDSKGVHYSNAREVLEVPLWFAGGSWRVPENLTQKDVPRIIADNLGIDFAPPTGMARKSRSPHP